MEEKINIDEINEIMTEFLDGVVKVAKIHTEFKEKLTENHEYTKLACSMVKIFNQYQSLYVYIQDQEEYARNLVECSRLAIEVLSFKPYEMLEGSLLKKKKQIKATKAIREEKLKELNQKIDYINLTINHDIK